VRNSSVVAPESVTNRSTRASGSTRQYEPYAQPKCSRIVSRTMSAASSELLASATALITARIAATLALASTSAAPDAEADDDLPHPNTPTDP
jgi:hypothetical protein